MQREAYKATATVLKGRVSLSRRFSDIEVGFRDSQLSDVNLILDSLNADCTISIAGGTAVLRNGDGSEDVTFEMYAGKVTMEDFAANSLAARVRGGTLVYESTQTITSLQVDDGATADFSTDRRQVTITNTTLPEGSNLIDPFKRITYTNPVSTPDGLKKINWDTGPDRTFAVANA